MSTLLNDEEKLIAALRAQKIVDNDLAAAKELAQVVRIQSHVAGDAITQQGDLTDEMYFILSGRVEVLVNGRYKAYRGKGETVGEMSLVDIGGTRSATVIVNQPSVLARIEQQDFTKVANQYTDLWRNIAKCLAERLRQRNDRERVKNPKPIIFIASSSERKSTMDAIEQGIKSDTVEVRPWTSDGLFEPSTHAIETLEEMAKNADFAVIVLSPDDTVKFRGSNMPSPRDNVIFEQGLFVGGIGRRRTIIVECLPKQCWRSKLPLAGKLFKRSLKIPSDFYGLTVFRCSSEEQLPDICEKISKHVAKWGTI
jgi:predicted nucleotide-binding protein